MVLFLPLLLSFSSDENGFCFKRRFTYRTNMSSKYVPPAKRKSEKPVEAPPPPPPEKKYEDEFPSLSGAPTTRRVWGGTSSFADKAREWSVKAEKDSVEEAARKKAEFESRAHSVVRALPKFHNVRRFVEPEEYEEETVEKKPDATNDEESGWTLVEKKVRKKKKSLTEIADEELAKASDEENSESVWNDEKELHETCWDERS
jgi:hypothetical protein